MSWMFQPNSIIFDIVIAVTRILVKFGQILGMAGQDLGKIIKMLHNLPDNHEMIISWKFQPNSIIFDRVIAVKSIFGPFWALFAQIWANGIFPEKSGSVTFLRLWIPNFMQEIRKILGANSEKQTD